MSIIKNSSILVKNKKLLSILNTSSKDCPICNRKSMAQVIRDVLSKKYMTTRDSYNVKVINDIIYNEVSHVVSAFKDYLIYDDISEFLRRIYRINECKQRLPKVFEFYEKYSKVFPNYVVLPESKNMFKNIEKKQKLIDEQQRMTADQKNKRMSLEDSDEDDKIFNTLFLNELNKPGSTYDINGSQQATESQLFSYIKNSKAKGTVDNTTEKSFNNLLEKVLLKESMSFANPINPHNMNEHDKKNPKSIIKKCAKAKDPAVCKVQIDSKVRASCIMPNTKLEKNNYISHLPQRSKEPDTITQVSKSKLGENNIRQSLNMPSNTQRLYSSQTSRPSNIKENFNSIIPNTSKPANNKAFSPTTKDISHHCSKNAKENIASPKTIELKMCEISKESKQESRNIKWQPQEKDHYLTNNILSDPTSRTHSSLKTPKPTHKFTDIDIHKLVNNINANNEKQKPAPMAFAKRTVPPSSNSKSNHKESLERAKTDRMSLQSRNSNTQSQSQMSVQGKQSQAQEGHERYKKIVPKDYNGLILDIDSINKHAKEIVSELQNRKIASTAKTPDCIKQNTATNRAKPSKAGPYILPQTVKSINNASRLLFSKSVSNADRFKYRLKGKATPNASESRKELPHNTLSSRASNTQTPGPASVQCLFKYSRL